MRRAVVRRTREFRRRCRLGLRLRLCEPGRTPGVGDRLDAALRIHGRDPGGGDRLVGICRQLPAVARIGRSEEHTSELQSLMRISYAVFCLKKKKSKTHKHYNNHQTKVTDNNETEKSK